MSDDLLIGAVEASMRKLVESGRINEIIEVKLGKLVESILDEQFRKYGDFGKMVEEAMSEALTFEPSNLNLPSYNAVIVDILRQKFDGIVEQRAREGMSQLVDELLREPPPEIKLSELVEEFKEHVAGYSNDMAGKYVSCVVEEKSESYGSRWVYIGLSEKPNVRDLYSCSFRLHCNANTRGEDQQLRVFTAYLGTTDLSKHLFLGDVHGFERTLFQLWAAKTPLVLDKAAIDLEIAHNPEYGDCDCTNHDH